MQAETQARPTTEKGETIVAATAIPRGPVMVVERWNSWVRVWSPETEQSYWVDLTEVEYEPTDGAESPADVDLGED